MLAFKLLTNARNAGGACRSGEVIKGWCKGGESS